ncbi:hypothetical protein ACFOPX_00285 [Helicobacter baculiformis]|uniref:Periplasmic protein n=1 Tax=Helicobacter baculiformis TaxID=427351 RepID=A0ABV7ZHW4_9HELI|nr:hypothetical protein [Helicobacter baculiformis]
MQALRLVFVALWLAVGVLQAEEALNTSLIHRAKKPAAHAHPKKKQTTLPRHSTNPKPTKRAGAPHRWIYSSVFLTAYFGDGHYKQGYGLLLQNGHYLTASSLVFDNGLYAQVIMAKMQDDSAPMLICVAKLHVKAIDRNRGLSLLATHVFTNDFCQNRPESYYHARIYKKYGQDLLTQKGVPDAPVLYYPQVSSKNAFEVQNLRALSSRALVQDAPYGRPLFSASGAFMGMLSANQKKAWVIKRETVLDFLRVLKERKLI